MLITPEAAELTTTLPEMVEQEAKAVASAWELMVAVAWEQMAELWAAAKLATARAGTMSF